MPGGVGAVRRVRAVKGVLPARGGAQGRAHLMVPRANAEEACLASGLKVIAVDHLLQAVAHFNGHLPIAPYLSDGLMHLSKPYPGPQRGPGPTGGQACPADRGGGGA